MSLSEREILKRIALSEEQQQEWYQAMIRQEVLLQKLRELGIAQIIEEVGENRIPSLAFPDADGNLQVNIFRTGSAMDRGDPYGEEWVLNPIPFPDGKGHYDSTLRIRPSRHHDFRRIDAKTKVPMISSLVIEFSEDQQLKVEGREVTFEGQVTGTVEQINQVREAIQRAFNNPVTKESDYAIAHLAS